MVGAALAGVRAIYRPDYKMAKAGVMLLELQPDSVRQQELALEGDCVVKRGQFKPGAIQTFPLRCGIEQLIFHQRRETVLATLFLLTLSVKIQRTQEWG